MIDNIITGEKMQQICNVYIGTQDDFNYNPIIQKQTNKHLHIHNITQSFNNPKIIFCYSQLISELASKIHYFTEKFILITHNSDHNIELTESVQTILNSNQLIYWYAQNLLVQHDKIGMLPIGFANSMWPHGNLIPFNDYNFIHNLSNKTQYIYFNFGIHTNQTKRSPCYETLKNDLEWLQPIDPVNNLYRLKEYRFCICPEGNGVDTHRLWECLYLKVVPIVINTPFTQMLTKYNIPLVVLNEWSDILNITFNYNDYSFDNEIFKNLISFNNMIKDCLHRITTHK
jgi:hypothetical protein